MKHLQRQPEGSREALMESWEGEVVRWRVEILEGDSG